MIVSTRKEVGGEQAQAEGVRKAGDALVIVGWLDVQQKRFRVRFQARVRAAWRFAAQHAAHFAGGNAGRDAREDVICSISN